MEAVERSGGGRRLWRRLKASEAASTKPWRRQEAIEAVEGCGGDQRLWTRSKAPKGNIVEALETAGSCGDSRKLWRRSNAMEEIRGSGGVRRLRRQ